MKTAKQIATEYVNSKEYISWKLARDIQQLQARERRNSPT